MRKLFTQLFSILILSMVFVLQGFGSPAVGGVPLTPGSDFLNHKKANTLVLTAPEKVVAGTGVIRLKDSGGATLAAYQATSSNVVITAKSGGTYEIAVNFSSFLQEEQSYTLDVDEGFVKADDNGDFNIAGSWSVLEGDWTAPLLATSGTLNPANGASAGIQLDNNLTVKFNEPVQIAAGGQIFIYKDNGTSHGDLYEVIEAASVSGSTTNTLVINPTKDFSELTKYYVTIPEGVVVDYNGAPFTDNKNKFAGWLTNNTWAFTTRDASAPTIVSIMADEIAATSFSVFTKISEKGKVKVLAVSNGQTPVAADFVAGNGMKEATVTDPSVSVKVNLTQYLNVGTGVAFMVEGGDYDVWVMAENAETPATVGAPEKKLDQKTTDVTKPLAVGFYPAHLAGAADVNTKDKIYIVLNEDGKVGTGSVDIYTWSITLNHSLLVSVPAASCTVKNTAALNGDTLFIPVDKTKWASATTYFVKYNEGIVTDLAGNKLAGKTTTEDWKFTVKDFLAPTYTVVPANGEQNAGNAAPQVKITFNEPIYWDNDNNTATAVVAVDGANVTAFAAAALVLKKGTAVAPYTVSIAGNVVSLTITTVASRDAYELTVNSKKIFDASANAGTNEADKYAFTIKDFEGPTVTVEPVTPGATDNILVKFNEPVFNASGTPITDADVAGMVIFRKGTDPSAALVSATYSVAPDAKSFIINPTNDFTTPGDQYYVRLGAGAVKDAAGNANALKEQIITVKDFIAPTASFSGIGTSPVDPAGLVPVITFSEAMETLAGVAVSGDATSYVNIKENGENMAFTAAWGGTLAAPTITINSTFNPSKSYTISVGKSLQDVADNAFAGVSTSFSTWSNVAPTMVAVTPANNSVEQANNVVLTVKFDQPVVTGAGAVTFTGTAGAVGTVTVSGDMVTIGHTSFVNDETVTVTVPAGFVKGVNNLPSTVATVWSFKTHETVKPTVAAYSPAVGATGVALDSKLKLTFSENIVKKIGNIAIKDYTSDVTVQSLSEVNCVVKNNNELEITPVAAFDYNKKYYVVISEGIVEDAAGNKYVGITGTDKQWNFTATSNPGAFTVSDSDPKNNADKVAAGKNPIVVYFNRDIKAGSASATAKIKLEDGSIIVINDAANTGRFTYSGNMLSINTAQDVKADKTYTLTIDAGIVTDNWGTPNDGKVITFYTFDNNGPKVVSTTPLKDETNVPVSTTVVVNWDEKPLMIADGSEITAAKIKTNSLVTVNAGNAYTASVSADGLSWTLTMDAPFAENTLYPVVVKQTAVKDAGGKTQATDYNWSFTTKDATCNKPTAFVVTDNTKGTEVKFTVNFDEKGKVYYKIQPAGDAAPSAADIIAAAKVIDFGAAGTSAAQTVSVLTSGASYRAYFVAVDASVNANQSSIYDAGSFTTVDVVAPVVTAIAPANGEVGVAANTTLKLWFNETVVVGSGKVVIREVATDIIVETLNVTGANASIVTTDGKSVATITRTVALSSKKQYYAEIDGGTFKDGSNNPMAAITGVSNWAFTTKDTVAPLLVKTVPDYAAATTPLIIKGSALTIEFNEAMKAPTTGTIYVRYITNNAVFEVVNANALTLSADNKTFSFSMLNVPAEQTEFWVDLSSIAFTDLADNAWSSLFTGYDLMKWNFIIKDQTPPAIATIVPANNATGVVIGTNVVITFTEGIYKNTDPIGVFTTTTIKDVIALKDPAGASIAYTATLVADGDGGVTTVTLDPTADLKSETKYTVTLSPVVDKLKNVSSTVSSVFTTKDMTAPKVSVWNPAYDTQFNPKTGVVTVTFSEAIYDEVTITSENNPTIVEIIPANIPSFFTYNKGTITRGGDGKINGFTAGTAVGYTGAISADRKVITLTPVASAVPLSSEAWYRVQLIAGVVEDIADNTNAADETIFSVEDFVTPTATAYTPQGATANNAAMTITFDEKVQVGTGNVYVRNYVNGEVVETIAISSSTATIDATGKIVTIKHADFPAAMNFFATADAGTFKDISANANAWAGIAIDQINVWKFSTADAVPPVVVPQSGLYPTSGATNVALNTGIQVIFDKEIKLNPDLVTRWIVIYNEDWTPSEVIPVSAATVELKPITTPVYKANRIMSIKHANLDPSKKYYVRVMPGSVVDLAGNLFAGIMDDSWFFSTEDNNPPALVSLTPADNSTGVDNKTNLVMTFDRSIVANAAGSIKLYKESQPGQLGQLIETINPTSASVIITEKVATITLKEWLEYETGYYVIVETGAFTGTSTDNWPYAGITTTQGWNFKVEKLICDPIDVVATVKDQLECSAVVNINVVSDADYVLTLDGDTITAGDITLAAGDYVVVAHNLDGDCSDTQNLTVGSDPVVKKDTVETYLDEPVHYVNVEAGIDTMLVEGIHTFTYDYMSCVRTLIVNVVEEMRTPKIAEIQGQGDVSPLDGAKVKVLGTVTAVAPGEGFFIQDASAAWSGIWVEFDKATYEGIQIGNGVSVIGEVAEVASVTSIVNATMEFVPPMVNVTSIVLENPSDLKAEKYESVLVKVEGARASAPAAGTGEWTIYYHEANNALVNDWLYFATVTKGNYYDVTGIVNARLDNYKLEPRIESDVKDLTVTKVDPELANTFKVYPNPFNDQITIDNNEKLTRVVISNIAGQRVIDIEYPTREIRTANLVSGIYVISLYTENGIAKTERMIKR